MCQQSECFRLELAPACDPQKLQKSTCAASHVCKHNNLTPRLGGSSFTQDRHSTGRGHADPRLRFKLAIPTSRKKRYAQSHADAETTPLNFALRWNWRKAHQRATAGDHTPLSYSWQYHTNGLQTGDSTPHCHRHAAQQQRTTRTLGTMQLEQSAGTGPNDACYMLHEPVTGFMVQGQSLRGTKVTRPRHRCRPQSRRPKTSGGDEAA